MTGTPARTEYVCMRYLINVVFFRTTLLLSRVGAATSPENREHGTLEQRAGTYECISTVSLGFLIESVLALPLSQQNQPAARRASSRRSSGEPASHRASEPAGNQSRSPMQREAFRAPRGRQHSSGRHPSPAVDRPSHPSNAREKAHKQNKPQRRISASGRGCCSPTSSSSRCSSSSPARWRIEKRIFNAGLSIATLLP